MLHYATSEIVKVQREHFILYFCNQTKNFKMTGVININSFPTLLLDRGKIKIYEVQETDRIDICF